MKQRLVLLPFALLAASLAGCGGGEPAGGGSAEPLARVVEAAERTAATGSSQVAVSVTSGAGGYRLEGRLTLDPGYRMCARFIRTPEGPVDYLGNGMLWVAGHYGTYDNIIRGRPPCEQGGWLDDHPPTVPLHRGGSGLNAPPGGETGGENFLHLALLALTQMSEGAVSASQVEEGDGGDSYRVLIDFERLDRKPPERDEDAWYVRPLLRSLGEVPVTVELDGRGRVQTLELETPHPAKQRWPSREPVTVVLQLSAIGEAASVPMVEATAIE